MDLTCCRCGRHPCAQSASEPGCCRGLTPNRLFENHSDLRSIPPGLQTACKQTRPRLPACWQAGSRQKREVLTSPIVVVGGVDGTRTRGLRRDSHNVMRPRAICTATYDRCHARVPRCGPVGTGRAADLNLAPVPRDCRRQLRQHPERRRRRQICRLQRLALS